MHKIFNSKHCKLLAWLLVFGFLISSNLLTNHKFNHEITDFLADDASHEPIVAQNDQQVLALKTLDHKSHSKQSDCDLCFSSIIQSQLLSFSLIVFSVLLCSFLVILAKHYYLSKNCLTSLNLARAPPSFL